MEIILVWLGRGGLGFSLMTGRFLGVVPSQMLGGETWFNEFMIYYTEYTHNMRRREEEEEGGTGLFGCFCCLERERESTTTGFLWWPRYPRLLYYLLFGCLLLFLFFGDGGFVRCVSLPQEQSGLCLLLAVILCCCP